MKTESEILAAVATEIFLTLCDHEGALEGGFFHDEELGIALDLVCDAIEQIENRPEPEDEPMSYIDWVMTQAESKL